MAVWAIGDVHGCLDELEKLFAKVGFDQARDRAYFLGDLVGRGPNSLGVLRFVLSLGSAATAILGNHDLNLLALAQSSAARPRSFTKMPSDLLPILGAADRDSLLGWLRSRPLWIDFRYNEVDFLLAHAGVYPLWDLETCRNEALRTEVSLGIGGHPGAQGRVEAPLGTEGPADGITDGITEGPAGGITDGITEGPAGGITDGITEGPTEETTDGTTGRPTEGGPGRGKGQPDRASLGAYWRSSGLRVAHFNRLRPNRWSAGQPDEERTAAALAAFTRMRFTTRGGGLDYRSTDLTAPANDYRPWFNWPLAAVEGKASLRILFGHWAALRGRANSTWVRALDTGCVWGGSLTAYSLDDDRKVEVESEAALVHPRFA